jgi:putative endonuclease
VGSGRRKTEKYYYVYLLASKRNGTLYIGVTNDLVRRVGEHKAGLVPGFTKKYKVDKLMWFEVHTSIDAAIQREKRIKEWQREWKIDLFRDSNPDWTDLYPGLTR